MKHSKLLTWQLAVLLLPVIAGTTSSCGKRTFYKSTGCEKSSENVLTINFKSKKGNTRQLNINSTRKMILLTQSIHPDTQWAVEFKQIDTFSVDESSIFSVELKNGDSFNFGTINTNCLNQTRSLLENSSISIEIES